MSGRPDWRLDAAPRAAPPPRRWRNWWRAERAGRLPDGTPVPAGCLLRSRDCYPSREVAEQKALDHAARDRANGFAVGRYWGALPEGEAPDGERP